MQMPLAAVIGWPIDHSLSPVIHNYWLKKYDLIGNYEKIATAPPALAAEIEKLKHIYRGWNVTLPHKEAIIPLLDQLTPTAQAIGAVNCVSVQPNGTLLGDNTDAYGFAENLRQQTARSDWTGKHAVVLGAGGAARAVVYALAQLGFAQITICNRNAARAQQLITALSSARSQGRKPILRAEDNHEWLPSKDLLTRCNLLVNTTSLGMHGQPPLTIDLATLPAHAVVADIVYKPLQTELLKQAAARGLTTVDGLGMLLHQAAPAFEKFFGVKPEVTDELRQHICVITSS